jgi:hypothetical protein
LLSECSRIEETRTVPLANELHATIERVDTLGMCGWIVDLRGNAGGNMWPQAGTVMSTRLRRPPSLRVCVDWTSVIDTQLGQILPRSAILSAFPPGSLSLLNLSVNQRSGLG